LAEYHWKDLIQELHIFETEWLGFVILNLFHRYPELVSGSIDIMALRIDAETSSA